MIKIHLPKLQLKKHFKAVVIGIVLIILLCSSIGLGLALNATVDKLRVSNERIDKLNKDKDILNKTILEQDSTIEDLNKTVKDLQQNVNQLKEIMRNAGNYSDTGRQTLFEMTNAYRVSKGLKPLKHDLRLDYSACSKAKDMDNKDYFDHYGSNGETPWQFIISAGYEYSYAGENLATMFSSIDKTVLGWINSPKHEQNLSNISYTSVGFCIIEATLPECPTNYKEVGCHGAIIKGNLIVQHFGAEYV